MKRPSRKVVIESTLVLLVVGIILFLIFHTWTKKTDDNLAQQDQSSTTIPEPSGTPSPGSPAALLLQRQQSIIGCYHVVRGDNLWKLADRAYGHATMQKVRWIQTANANRITNPDHIEIGWWICIPPIPAVVRAKTNMTGHRKARSSLADSESSNEAGKVNADASVLPLRPEEERRLPRFTNEASSLEQEPSTPLALPATPPVLPKFSYGSTSHTRVVLANTIGYRFTLPRPIALQSRIPLKGNFETQIFLFESEQDKARGWFTGVINHINTRVQTRGNEVTLNFALKQLPSKPFTVAIAGNKLDGTTFTLHAQPFAGKFPGPGGHTRMFFAMGRVSIPYAIACGLTASPFPAFIGLGHMIVPAVMGSILRHSADRLEAKAEAKLQKDLADNRKLLNGVAMPPGIMPITSIAQLPGGGLQ